METDSATLSEPAQQAEAIFSKDTWTHQDCVELCRVLFEMPTGTEKLPFDDRVVAREIIEEGMWK